MLVTFYKKISRYKNISFNKCISCYKKIFCYKKAVLIGLALAITSVCWGNSAYIYAKAYLAQYLIEDAWQETLSDGKNHKPWRWADTWPVGKLVFPTQYRSLYVLAGSHGTSLAFGPGHMDGTALPDETGTKVFSGHRDTHFSFLRKINIGERFLLQDKHGGWHIYTFKHTTISDIRTGPWLIDANAGEVHLITCYPFNALIPGGPWRFIATASPAE
ncbi:MAG: sortase A [Lentisphaeria bacterium]|jgi:sortase A